MSVFTYVASKPRKVRRCGAHWRVTNHPAAPRVFDTWREAMDYANARYTLINQAAS